MRAADGSLDVAKFLQGLNFTPFHRRILILSCLVTFFDGLDFSLIAYTLPYIRDEMSLNEAMMGNVSAAAFIGQMIGSLVGSYIADVIGRRPVILWCTVLSAVLTFVTGFAQTPEMLMLLRLLGGLTIGGLLAPAWSLNVEAMPAGKRATAVTIVMLGFSTGAAAAGWITNWIAPLLSWHYVFFVCGALTLALAVLLQFTLPESARWLVAKGRPAATVMPLLSRFDPGTDLSRYHSFYLSDERSSSKSDNPLNKIGELFKGWLAYITPLIWAAYFFSSFAIYLKSSFGVLFLEELGLSVQSATWIGSIGGLTGAIAGVALLALTEKRGPAWITLAPAVAIPFLLLVGLGIILDGALFIPVIFIGSVLVGAGHAGVISITSVYYPSAARATGGGWASFMAKFAAVAAPLVGAALFLGSEQKVLHGYLFSAACLAGIIVCILALSQFAKRLVAEREAEQALADERDEADGAAHPINLTARESQA
ncbi:4-hydroxybenzoate transporter PcaK [Croceibacterium atlanticum]|uniref:4-hydroxybenzoate transporter PcaK n=2 Tax=Croceibacterium atlanticum TaxID=1267766 RepID=A0A0F7KTW5_9SPHN|nr:MFS transporter [Croceibacterium atlanticum]AKH42601.1 4-hydroxybenzoate transporter PcaK [Croceibacterium atlanticum]